MYLIHLTYTVPLDKVEETAAAHRIYLDLFIASGHLLITGRTVPPTGAVLLAKFKSPEELAGFIAGDPLSKDQKARFEVIEFTPGKHAPEAKAFLDRWASANA